MQRVILNFIHRDNRRILLRCLPEIALHLSGERIGLHGLLHCRTALHHAGAYIPNLYHSQQGSTRQQPAAFQPGKAHKG